MDAPTNNITAVHNSYPTKSGDMFSCSTQTNRSYLISQRRWHKILKKMLQKNRNASKRSIAKRCPCIEQLKYSSKEDLIKVCNNLVYNMAEKSESNLSLRTDSLEIIKETLINNGNNPEELRLYGGTAEIPKVRCKIRQRDCFPMHRLRLIRDLYYSCKDRISNDSHTHHSARNNTQRYFRNERNKPSNKATTQPTSSKSSSEATKGSETSTNQPVMNPKSVLKRSRQTVEKPPYTKLSMNQKNRWDASNLKSNTSFGNHVPRRSVSFDIPTSQAELSTQGCSTQQDDDLIPYELPNEDPSNYTAYVQPQNTQMFSAATNQMNISQSLATDRIPTSELENDEYLRSESPTTWLSHSELPTQNDYYADYNEEDILYDSDATLLAEDISSEDLIPDYSDTAITSASSDEAFQDPIQDETTQNQPSTYDYDPKEILQSKAYRNSVADSNNAQLSAYQNEYDNQINNEANIYETTLEHSKGHYSTDLFDAPNESYNDEAYKFQHTSATPNTSYNYKNYNSSKTLKSQVQAINNESQTPAQTKRIQVPVQRRQYQTAISNNEKTKYTQVQPTAYSMQPHGTVTSKHPQTAVYNKQTPVTVTNKKAQTFATSKQSEAAVYSKQIPVTVHNKQAQNYTTSKQSQAAAYSKQAPFTSNRIPLVPATSRQTQAAGHNEQAQLGISCKLPQISLSIKPTQLHTTVNSIRPQAPYCRKPLLLAGNQNQTQDAGNIVRPQNAINFQQQHVAAHTKQSQIADNSQQFATKIIQFQPATGTQQSQGGVNSMQGSIVLNKQSQFDSNINRPQIPTIKLSLEQSQLDRSNKPSKFRAYSERPQEYVQTKPISVNDNQSKYSTEYDYHKSIKRLTASISEANETVDENLDSQIDLDKHKKNIKHITNWSKETLLPEKFSMGTLVCANVQTPSQYPTKLTSPSNSANSMAVGARTSQDDDYMSMDSVSQLETFSPKEIENIAQKIRNSESSVTNKMSIARHCAQILTEQHKTEHFKTTQSSNYVPLPKSESLKTMLGKAAQKPTTTKDALAYQTKLELPLPKQLAQQVCQDISKKSVNDRDWKIESKAESSVSPSTKIFTGQEGKDLEDCGMNILKAYTTLKSYGGDELLTSVFTEFKHLYANADKKNANTKNSGDKSKYIDELKAKLYPSSSKNIDNQAEQKETIKKVSNTLETEKIVQKSVTETETAQVNKSQTLLENRNAALVDTTKPKDIINTRNVELKINKALKTSSVSIVKSIRNEVKDVYNVELSQKPSTSVEEIKRKVSVITELSPKSLKKSTENKQTSTVNDDKKRLFYVIDEEKYRQIVQNEIDILDAINIDAYVKPEKIDFSRLWTKPDFLIQKTITDASSDAISPKSEETYIKKHKYDFKRLSQLEKKIKQISEEIGRYKSLLIPEKNVNMHDIDVTYHTYPKYSRELGSSSGGSSIVESHVNHITVQRAVIDSYQNIPGLSKVTEMKKEVYNTKKLETELQSIITPKTSNVFKTIDIKIETDAQMSNKFYDCKAASAAATPRSSGILKDTGSKQKETLHSEVKAKVPTPKTSGSMKSTASNKRNYKRESEKQSAKHEPGMLRTESNKTKTKSSTLKSSGYSKNAQSEVKAHNLPCKDDSSDERANLTPKSSSVLKNMTKNENLLSLFSKETLSYLSESQSVTSNSSITYKNYMTNRKLSKFMLKESQYSDTETVTPKSSDLSRKVQTKQKTHYTFSKEEHRVSATEKQVLTPKSSILFKSRGLRPNVCLKVDNSSKRCLSRKSSNQFKCECKQKECEMKEIECNRVQKLFTLMESNIMENPLEKFSLISMFMDFQDALKDCKYCKDKQLKVLNEKVFEEILRIIKDNDPASIVLTVNLHSNALYHINVGLPECNKSLGCLYATEKGIKEAARDEKAFEEFMTFFVANEGKSIDLKLKALDHAFDAVAM